MLEHIKRLKVLQALDLPAGLDRLVHQNRLLKMARQGSQMTPADLAKFEPQRRYATLMALVLEGTATVTDEIIDLHDRILGRLFNAAKHKHQLQFQHSGKSINHKLRLFGRVGHLRVSPPEVLGMTLTIVLWNTVYLERAIAALVADGHPVDKALLPYLSLLGWEHINLTGDYFWRSNTKIRAGKFRPLRAFPKA